LLSKNPVSNKYITDYLINNNINHDNLDNGKLNNNNNSNKSSYILYGSIGGGVLFITTSGLFLAKRLSNSNRRNDEVQMDSIAG